MKLFKNKRGVFNQLTDLAIGIGIFAVVTVVVTLIVSNVGSNTAVSSDSNATKVIQLTQAAIQTLPTWLTVIIVVAVGALLLSMVMMFRQRTE
jgi:hypothetical protein